MTKNNFYITTTLPYVNSVPHIGFALEVIQADIIARYRRLKGDNVFFNFGTDEHGQKIWQKAKEEGRDVKEYVDFYAESFKRLKGALNLSYDAFIRTTDPHHEKSAMELWKRSLANGDIEKKKYKGLYCVGCELFLKESELVDEKCPNHPNLIPEEIEEENYFFKFSKYQKQLLSYLKKDDVILPDWRRQEAIKFVESGLEDFSISRLKERMSWGVDVPGDSKHTMYVWFDALSNYISTLGWPEDKDGNFEKFWNNGKKVQYAGKDQVRFQSLMWQAMLLSAGIQNTDTVVYHGFVTSSNQKMSKSLGNVIDPFLIVEEYGTDALRYFMAREISTFDDSDFTMERFHEAYTANLVNGLGNLTSRIMRMAVSYDIDLTEEEKKMSVYAGGEDEYLEKYEIGKKADEIWQFIGFLDATIQKEEPFKLIKTNPDKAKKIVHELLYHLLGVALMIEPFMPETSEKIKRAIKEHKMPEPLFPRKA